MMDPPIKYMKKLSAKILSCVVPCYDILSVLVPLGYVSFNNYFYCLIKLAVMTSTALLGSTRCMA